MKIFETQRLIIRRLEVGDKEYFSELFTDPKILERIPQTAFTENQITDRFSKNLNLELADLNNNNFDCGIYERGKTELIGLSLFLINENNDKELGYRFRVNYWEKGYGTETTKGMLEYYFQQMKVSKVTADVNIANVGSVKILNKFMDPINEFFNVRDQCMDRRYEIKRESWLKEN